MNETPPHPTRPRLRLDFYETAVLLARWEEDGRLLTYPVSVHDVAGACAQVERGSGLLPAGTLFWRQAGGETGLGLFVPGRRRRVQVETAAGERVYRLPLPPLVFVGEGSRYRVFAVKERPLTAAAPLYHAPCPNVHADGGVCQGNAPFPACSSSTMQGALTLFLEGSLFNGDLSRGKCRSHPDDVRRLWAALDGRKRFPLSELIPAQMTLGHLL